MATSTHQDAIALLKADHRKVEGLFEAFASASGAAKKKLLATQICMELTIHTKIEEDIFYPACRKLKANDKLNEAYVEHDGAKLLLVELESGEAGGEFYDAQVKVLSEQIAHHVREEEQPSKGIFALARNGGLDLDMLGEKLAAEKARLMADYKADGLPTPQTPTLLATKLGQASRG